MEYICVHHKTKIMSDYWQVIITALRTFKTEYFDEKKYVATTSDGYDLRTGPNRIPN